MSLSAGTRIGPYEVLAPLGAGGMGEVYRARDGRLERTVAIKSLPNAFAADPQRLSRFEREAKLLASLSHPNIAAIYGLEEAEGSPFLVLELVEGETLSQRLTRGPLSARETIEVGVQMAAAIEAAHERGIVHRDLKPGNVMITPSRVVKVLDFGLAKGGATETPSSSDFSVSPTVAIAATLEGVILGTAPYMSPEQARGRAVDRRTDVWAFGCVLYECLTGRPSFAGDTVTDVIARILEREPDWSALPPSTPPRLRELMGRCLIKEHTERPRDIGDLRLALAAIGQELAASSSASAPVVAASAKPSLAVLYFENLARDSDSEYFCSGITEDILTDLSKIKGLRVASRNAVARYRGHAVDIARVATELGVGAVLEGSVRKAGDRVRISAQLISASDGFHLWADRYDRTLDDVFAVQEEIASSIAEALRVALTPAESKNLVKDRPNDVRAYDLYLKGRAEYGRYSAESLRRALELFQQAAAIDPEYALAYAGMADCYGQMNQWGGAEPGWDLNALGMAAADRAIELNPRLPEAYKAKGLVSRFLNDPAGSRAALSKAIEVDPRFTPAILNLAVDDFRSANLAGCERMIRRALDVDPQEAFGTGWLSFLLCLTSREEEALVVARRQRTLTDAAFYVYWSHGTRIWVAMRRNDVAGVQVAMQDALADGVAPTLLSPQEAWILARAGRREEAVRRLEPAEHEQGLGAGGLVAAAMAAIAIGDVEKAVGFLTRPVIDDFTPILARLEHGVHATLSHPSMSPRRLDRTLVWPLEAPMIDAARHALFREVRVESGLPTGSDVSAAR